MTIHEATNAELLGRDDINDLEAIMAVSASDQHEAIRAVKDNAEAIFTWDYEKGKRPALNKLYEKAKTSQWNGETDLDWSIDVDLLEVAHLQRAMNPSDPADRIGTPFEKWTRPSSTRWPSSRTTGCSASSCTASRAPSSARRRSSRRCRGSTPSTTRPPR